MRTRFAALCLAAGIAAGFVSPARAQESPLDRAVRDFDPAFTLDPARTWRADFDGDGREDVAAILQGPGRRALVVFRARERGYTAQPLYASLPDGEVELRLVDPGSRRVVGPQGVVQLDTPGLELSFPGKSSALYVWRGERFHSFATENH